MLFSALWMQLFQGLWQTLVIFLFSMVGALLIGLCGALASVRPIPWLRGLVQAYTTLFRSVPELIIIFLLYFGGSVLINGLLQWLGNATVIEPQPMVAGIFSLSLVFGAYSIEIFRSALLAVLRGDIDAAYSLGMSRRLVYGRIVLPQLCRYAFPGLSNVMLVLLKDTALLSVIGVNELMRATKTIIGYTKQPFTFYLTAALLYLFMTSIGLLLLRYGERWAFRGMPKPQALQNVH
jgi:putative lysine/arginine/ornithine/histidine/octopine transport system permease protein